MTGLVEGIDNIRIDLRNYVRLINSSQLTLKQLFGDRTASVEFSTCRVAIPVKPN